MEPLTSEDQYKKYRQSCFNAVFSSPMNMRCQIYLKKNVLFVTSLRRLKHISKRCLFWDVSETSQKYLVEVFVTFQKYPTKMVLSGFLRVTELSDKVDERPWKTLKKWNIFWKHCIAINQISIIISGLIFVWCAYQ